MFLELYAFPMGCVESRVEKAKHSNEPLQNFGDLGNIIVLLWERTRFGEKSFLGSILENESVAQLVEQRTFNPWVLGSSPSALIGVYSRRIIGEMMIPRDVLASADVGQNPVITGFCP